MKNIELQKKLADIIAKLKEYDDDMTVEVSATDFSGKIVNPNFEWNLCKGEDLNYKGEDINLFI